ncbi:restriction endonuclease subunit S [Mangrovibrevibacter kandeliae]|uniref:restriction endonuclease subunit S n=1 Tax=Mangrovibrevibacter kandeliae TaxID=2968473 RepID=UPI002118FAEA|nr:MULTISPECIES: restriction endonuclease subunit S [unclassified Aurantimonas]MCQ8783759.1 restriction endonuclease subunit S [Aurantimonas sp. CSK15Z-1]MCW4116279.1 restriction endonuclease subunit S [Aurantimonas sp. MSK8Z-1]
MEHIETGGRSVSFSRVASDDLSSSKFEFGPHHVLFGKLRPYLAKIACPEFDGICSTDILPILPGPHLDQRYLAHFLRQQQIVDWASSRATGINLPRLSPKELTTLEIPLPPLDEQRRIAAILDKADALRRKRKRALDLLDGLTQSIVGEIYRRAAATVALGELFDIQGGLQVTGARATLSLEVPYLRVANVHRSRLDLSEIKRMRVKSSELERTSLSRGDLLFVEGHGNADEVGRCAVWDGSIEDCTHQNHLIRARPLSNATDTSVLCHWLNGPDGRRHLSKRGKTTSGLNTISVSDVKNAPIPLLPHSDTDNARKQLNVIEGVRSQLLKSGEGASLLFASLQSRAFSGQL